MLTNNFSYLTIMKRICFYLVALFVVTACATWQNLPNRIESFVDKAEANADYYTTEDWQESNAEFEALISEFHEYIDNYSDEEKDRVMKDIGRYHALTIVNGIKDASDFIKFLKDEMPSYLEGINEVVGEEKGGVIESLKQILGPSDILDSVEELMKSINEFAEEAEDELGGMVEEREQEWEEFSERFSD